MTECELYKAAYNYVLALWSREIERKDKLNKEGKTSPIADAKIKKYNAQLDELHEVILDAEKRERGLV